MNKVIDLSKENSVIIKYINKYKTKYDYKCNEGYINENGIVLGTNGSSVNVNKSYSNMKGIGYSESLIEYDTVYCVTSKDNNTDRYILSANPSKNSISIVINLDSEKYINQIIDIFNNYNVPVNILLNHNNNYINYTDYSILVKGNNEKDFEYFNNLNINFFCVKTNDFDVIPICSKNNINTIYMRDEITKDLLLNIKKGLSKGDIIFIKENKYNLNEISATIRYIKSRGINIVSIEKLVS
jgi:hypothetical protein